MKYRKLPVEIEATQWLENGDHPQDNSVMVDGPDESFLSEGEVVRYYRHPKMDGDTQCSKCGNNMHWHGWIETLEGGHIVCPKDFIITGIAGEVYPCKPDIFEKTYEAV